MRGELFAFASEKLVEAQGDVARYRELLATRPGLIEFMAGGNFGGPPGNERISPRTGERRVGEEGRIWGGAGYLKKKKTINRRAGATYSA